MRANILCPMPLLMFSVSSWSLAQLKGLWIEFVHLGKCILSTHISTKTTLNTICLFLIFFCKCLYDSQKYDAETMVGIFRISLFFCYIDDWSHQASAQISAIDMKNCIITINISIYVWFSVERFSANFVGFRYFISACSHFWFKFVFYGNFGISV